MLSSCAFRQPCHFLFCLLFPPHPCEQTSIPHASKRHLPPSVHPLITISRTLHALLHPGTGRTLLALAYSLSLTLLPGSSRPSAASPALCPQPYSGVLAPLLGSLAPALRGVCDLSL